MAIAIYNVTDVTNIPTALIRASAFMVYLSRNLLRTEPRGIATNPATQVRIPNMRFALRLRVIRHRNT